MTTPATDIVVTGLAAISAAGVGLAPLREALRRGESMLRPVPEEILGESGHLWGKAEQFKAADFIPPLKARKLDRCSQFAVVAARMALADAGLEMKNVDPTRVGIVLGCGFGGIATSAEFLTGYLTQGTDGLVPMLFPNTVPNAPTSNASIEHGIKGPNVTTVQRFCSAESALFLAARFLEEDRADVILTGGFDELTPLMLKGFKAAGQLASHGRGFGEGAGILVLEKGDHARKRGAAIKARIEAVRTVGLLVPGNEAEGVGRLTEGRTSCDLLSLSGTAADVTALAALLPAGPRLEVASMVGRSLAMGGIALVSLILLLPENASALHLAASPQGPYYAVDVRGGTPG